MPYTTNQLITGAYYVGGVVSREFETVSGGQIAEGLQWLNDILTEKRVDEGMIPYETTYTFYGVIGQEKYWIPGLIEIDTCVFYLQDVRYPMAYSKRNQYFGTPRVQNIQTLPYTYYFEREVGGGNLYVYFEPNQQYLFEIHGIFDIPPVSLDQDLSAVVTTADLGAPTVYYSSPSGFSLAPGQFVINNFDLAGFYPYVDALINYINSGVIPGVQAKGTYNAATGLYSDVTIFSATEPPVPIYISSTGWPPNGTRFITTVKAASTVNLVANYDNGSYGRGATLVSFGPGALILDGISFSINDTVLIKNQTNEYENGFYTVFSPGDAFTQWVLIRQHGYNVAGDISQGDIFSVLLGDTQGTSTWIQDADVAEVGISPILFLSFTGITFANFSTVQQSNYQVYNALGLDEFYTTYLRYELAHRICSEYSYKTPENVLMQLNKYTAWIKSKSRLIDLRMVKTSTLSQRGTYSYSWINLGRGWVSPQ